MKKALVLLNMGGPNNLEEVGLFLHNMFNDANIITVKSSLLRRFIAFMITSTRTKKAQANYAKLGGKSPLVGYTRELVEKLQQALPSLHVDFAMRYTPPFCEELIQNLKQKGIQEVFLLPLYPHYSTTTTKSSLEDFEAVSRNLDFFPKVSALERFYENKAYNQLLLDKIQETLGETSASSMDIIFSAHSLPQKIIDNGDPYQEEVCLHVKILTELLASNGFVFNATHLAYQSKLGPVKWLEPSLEQTLKTLTNKRVIIVPLSFTVDNSETEFELSIEYKEVAHAFGYEDYRVVRCPNADDAFVKCLANIVLNIV